MIEDLYQQIGQYIAETVPSPWEKAWICVEFKVGVISSQGKYLKPLNSQEYSFPVQGFVNRLFGQLRKTVKKDEENMCAKACFTLHPDQHFEIQFEYE